MKRDRLGQRITVDSIVLCVWSGEVFRVKHEYRSGMDVIYLESSIYSMDVTWYRVCMPIGGTYEVLR